MTQQESKNMCDDTKCKKSVRKPVSLEIEKIPDNVRDVFRYWTESLEWDGVPRLRRAFIDYLGASAADLRPNDSQGGITQAEEEYIGAVTEAWFMCIASRIYQATSQMVVPVLTGEDCRFIRDVLNKMVCVDGFDWVGSCDCRRMDFNANLFCEKLVIEVSAPSSISEGELFEFSKSICDMEVRLKESVRGRPRRAALIVVDPERGKFHESWDGGVLFYPIECGTCGKELTPYVREQIWAEAMHLYKEGHEDSVDSEARHQSLYIQECEWFDLHPEVQGLEDWLDSNHIYSKKGSVISFQTIMKEYFVIAARYAPEWETSIWKTWVHHTSKWYKVRGTTEVKGVKTSMAYVRIADAGAPRFRLPESVLPFEKDGAIEEGQDRKAD